MRTSHVVISIARLLILVGAALAAPADAETISLSCKNTPISREHIVNFDLASAHVTEGNAEDQGTGWGPYAAQISALIIAWDAGHFHKRLNRVTGDLHVHGNNCRDEVMCSDWHEACRPIPPPKGIF
jgi:hypothetical protein